MPALSPVGKVTDESDKDPASIVLEETMSSFAEALTRKEEGPSSPAVFMRDPLNMSLAKIS